jgi:hypothetical protein
VSDELKQLEPVDYVELLTWVEKAAPNLPIPQQVGLCMQRSHGKADPKILTDRLTSIQFFNGVFDAIERRDL